MTSQTQRARVHGWNSRLDTKGRSRVVPQSKTATWKPTSLRESTPQALKLEGQETEENRKGGKTEK